MKDDMDNAVLHITTKAQQRFLFNDQSSWQIIQVRVGSSE